MKGFVRDVLIGFPVAFLGITAYNVLGAVFGIGFIQNVIIGVCTIAVFRLTLSLLD